MPTDRTRPSDDLRQGYRGVRFQQGRVLLDRDLNAGEEITAAEFRHVGLLVVGPVGAPDDGYKITAPTTAETTKYDFHVTGGTIFVGGVRVTLANSVTSYFKQGDWLTPDPADPVADKSWNEFVYLRVTEVEVSAREDPDLADVGLGGPDGAGRTRMVARVGRMRVAAADCKAAFLEAQSKWAEQGFIYNEPTALLLPQGKLKVVIDPTPGQTDLCQPEAVGGYLHPDNQCIRVKRTKANELIWGFDNASFLYSIDQGLPVGATKTLKIAPPPPDATRYPKANQVVEVLRSVARLPQGGTIAEADGFITKLASDYDPISSTVKLANDLTKAYQDATDPLFLRVWESHVEADGQLKAVSDPPGPTGVKVALSDGGPAVGSYWVFATRPETPQAVYPARLAKEPQIPDGPRDWVAPLAYLKWNGSTITGISDCRPKFDNLVELTGRPTAVAGGGGCCTITVGPEDVAEPGALKKLMEPYRQLNAPRLTVCFRPGTYRLHEPIILDKAFRGVTLHGCGHATLTAQSKAAAHTFLDGLVVVAGCPDATVSGLQFTPRGEPALAAFTERKVPSSMIAQLKQHYPSAQSAVAIRAVNATHLTVEGCEFTFPTPNDAAVFAAGVFAHGDCTGLRLTGCRFEQPREAARTDPNAGANGQFSQNNLKQIALAMYNFVDATKQPPRALGDLIPYTDYSPGLFVHPSAKKVLPTKRDEMPAWVNANTDYVYVPFRGKDDLKLPRVLVYENPLPGMVRINAALGDGSVRALTFELAREMIAQSGGQFEGVAAVPTARGWFGVLAWHVREATDKGQVSYAFRPVLDAVTLADNDFVGVSVPFLGSGDIGTVSVRDNRAADCTGGVWLSPPENALYTLFFAETKLGATLAESFPSDIKGLPADIARQLVEVSSRPLDFSVRVSDNHFDARPTSPVDPAPAVLIAGDPPPPTGSFVSVGATIPRAKILYKSGLRLFADRQTVTLSGNTLTGGSNVGEASVATVLIAYVDGAALTGNVIENGDLPFTKTPLQALTLMPRGGGATPGDRVAVTGNVFRGETNLDALPRSNKKPLWTDYNSEI